MKIAQGGFHRWSQPADFSGPPSLLPVVPANQPGAKPGSQPAATRRTVDNGKQSLYDRSVLIKPTGVLLIAAALAAFAQEAPKKPSSKKAGAVSQWVPP